jgi:hypothetical protein
VFGFADPTTTSVFCRVRWCFTASVPRDFYVAGSSSTANRACARPTVSLRVSFEALASNLLDGGPSLFAVQPPSRVSVSPSRHQTEVSTRSRLPFRDRRRPKPAQFRPRRFNVLDGLLHFDPWPTLSSRPPRPRFCLQGFMPHTQRDGLVTRVCPLVVGARCLSVLPPTPTSSAPPSGLCSVRGSVANQRGFSPLIDPRPSWVLLPSGSSPRTVKTRLRSRTLSAHSLGDHPREETTSDFRRVTDSRPGWLS